MFTLILTLYLYDSLQLTHVPHFTSEAACVAAGDAWQARMRRELPNHTRHAITIAAVCVNQGAR